MSISVGSVSVDVVPSTKTFAKDLKAKLKGVRVDVPVDLDTEGLREKVKEETKTQTPKVKVGADTDAFAAKIRSDAERLAKTTLVDLPITADAERLRRDIATQVALISKLSKVDIPVDIEEATQLRTKMAVELDILKAMAASAHPTVEVDADTTKAEAQIATVARNRRSNLNVGSELSSAFSSMSGLTTAIVALGPALIPITAAVAGLVAVLAAPLAAAGAGLTIGAFIAGFAIKDTEKQKKQIDELAKKVQSSKNALATATTPAGKKTAAAKLAEDTRAYQAALAGLAPAQRRFLAAQERLKESFHNLLVSAGGAVLGPVIKGMDLLAKLMPALRPLLAGVSKAIGTLLGDVSKMATGPGFKAFMRSFGREAGAAIVTFGRAFGSFAKGLFFLFRAFKPLSKDFTNGITGAFGSFASWAKALPQSKSFQSFLSYVRDVGPKVADTIGHIFGAFGKIVEVLAPTGGIVLGLVDALAQMIEKAKPGQIAAIAGALGGIALAVAAIGGPAVAIPAAIVALGGALGYAYKHSEPFRKVVQDLTGWFKDKLIPAVDDAVKRVWPAFQSAVDDVRESLRKNKGLVYGIRDAFQALGTILTDVVIPAQATMAKVELPALGKALSVGITTVRIQANAWAVLAIVALQSLKLLFQAAIVTFDGILSAADKGLGWLPGIGPKIHDARQAFDRFKDNTVAALDAAIGKAEKLQADLNFKPKTIRIHFAIDKPPRKSIQGVPIFQSFGAEGAGATGAIINRPTVLLAGENYKREALIPLSQTPGNEPLPGGLGGPQFVVEKVYAQDVNDFLNQMQRRARHSSLDGVPR